RRRRHGKGFHLHRREHQDGRKDLRRRAYERKEGGLRSDSGESFARGGKLGRQEKERKGQSVEEAHLRRAHGTERRRERSLRRVAGRLRARGNERDGNPKMREHGGKSSGNPPSMTRVLPVS